MLTFMLGRREELRINPSYRATAVRTDGLGSTGNTEHLNRSRTLQFFNAAAPEMRRITKAEQMIKGQKRQRTLKRAAIFLEIASLGFGKSKISELTGMSMSGIALLCTNMGLDIPKIYRQDNWLQRRVLRDHHLGLTSEVMAERYGTTGNAVRQTIYTLRQAGKLPPA